MYASIIPRVEEIIELAAKMKNAYFFRSPCTAHERRKYEQDHSTECVEWEENGHQFTAVFTTSCSCKNVYAFGVYTKDGKKTTLTSIKNSLNRMKQKG